ncbi:MAG: ankyrin repeat domain-containing protein [Chthoniobacteraceae bacterium]
MNGAIEEIHKALCQDNAATVRELLKRHPELKARINEPIEGTGGAVVTHARSREMLDVLLEAGADIDAKTRWWAGGFGLLHTASPELAAYAIERGATVDVHAAARLGRMDRLKELISMDQALVNARGGDGQTPLHFAATVEVAEFLLNHGAELEARDIDHESTPAQYMVRDRQEVLRFLIQRGSQTDLLMAAALGDAGLVRQHLDADPDSIRLRVSDEWFPMVGGKCGGTIYQWALGWHVSAHQVARKFGHESIYQLLMECSPDEVKLIAACWLGDEALVNSLLAGQPNLAGRLRASERRQLAHAARNNNTAPMRLMLAAGLPVDACSQHGATPLHWAAWHGNSEMVRLLLLRHPPLEQTDADFNGTPLRWAIHGSENSWDPQSGDYAATVRALLEAGAQPPDKLAGTDVVRELLRNRGVQE